MRRWVLPRSCLHLHSRMSRLVLAAALSTKKKSGINKSRSISMELEGLSHATQACVENKRSDWLTMVRDSVVRADVAGQKGGSVQRCSETGTKFHTNQFASRLAQVAAPPAYHS